MQHSFTNASSTPSSCITTSCSKTSFASATAKTPHTHSCMADILMDINIECTHRTHPPQFHSSSPSKYPIIGGVNTPTSKTGSNSPSSSSIPPGTRPHRKGPRKYPNIELDRLDTEKTSVITSLSGTSDVTLAPSLSATITTGTIVADNLEKGTEEQSEQLKSRQSSKAGVLRNVLKLQGIARLEKVRFLSVYGIQTANKIVMSCHACMLKCITFFPH